jgi:hypothetical protein
MHAVAEERENAFNRATSKPRTFSKRRRHSKSFQTCLQWHTKQRAAINIIKRQLSNSIVIGAQRLSSCNCAVHNVKLSHDTRSAFHCHTCEKGCFYSVDTVDRSVQVFVCAACHFASVMQLIHTHFFICNPTSKLSVYTFLTVHAFLYVHIHYSYTLLYTPCYRVHCTWSMIASHVVY